ncbi:PREDICTED: uncharacterized protein LOC109487245 [Branchiostoma belcheri]|uniref:Uncharacterized protein LOC109487245 n=1 Tax=Branchiostoma belcheri TaxID=7741 RepID=A0A6P5AXL6_BRABE|nr:PREDICTED: uncharacterized protein LOC109487245 [Branchiostoma belcheri]
MLRVCEKLREADEKGRRYGLAQAETGYLRALVDAMADTDRLAEVELLKTLGDVNVEKGRLGKDVGKFNTALALYLAAMVRCYHEEQADGIEHRYHYTERLLRGVSSQSKEQPTEDKETATPAKVAAKFQALDKRRATGGNTDSLLVGYAQVMVEAIVNDNSMLETEAIKSLGDVYLKRGTETGDTRNLTRATALYNRALARCHNVHGTVVIVHRLLHTAKIRQDIATTRNKKSRTQRQQDVRGRKGHFPTFSAAPSSDGTTSQVRLFHINISLFRSYRRYIQTADRDVRNGDLDAAEQNLAAALKLVHDRSKPKKAKEADCLCRFGDVYVERGKRTGEGRKFTQAAALYNASMARTDGDKQIMVTKLQETERQFLRNTCNLDCEPCPYSSALDHRKELDNSRACAKSQLEAVHQEHNPYQYDEDDPVVREVEIKRADAIKNLFKSIAVGRQEFIQVLTDECIAKLGPPPCKYAFIGMGSQATELVTPYSDLEFAILIEERKDNDDARRYFLNLTHYLHLKVINLGETILPAMAIPSLNDFLSEDPEKDWFYDSVTHRGFAFDGFMPWASKTPFGRDETKSKPPVGLIQTPAKLAGYQHLHIALAEGYHLSDILRRVSYLTGDESLVDDYTNRVNQCVDRSPALSRLSAMQILKEKDNIREIENAVPTAQLLNVKKEIYRFPSVAVDVLSICCGITIPSVWGMIEELHKTQRISHEDAHHLTVLISISAELRLRTYIANGGQKDTLSPLTEIKVQLDNHDVDDTIVESVFYIPDSKMLFRYYYTATPLKRCITYTVANPTTKMFPTAIFDTSSLTKGKITLQLLQLDTSRRHLEAALKDSAGDEEKQFEILYELGRASYMRGDYEIAKSYYDRARSIGNTIDGPTFASLLGNIGVCWNELGDQRKAISYHEHSLKMTKAIYGETTPHPDIASSLNNIGACWRDLGDQKKAISFYEQSLKMKKAIYEKAISYYEQSLKMRKAIYGETTPLPDIASSLNNIGNCWGDLGDQRKRKAISFNEQTLKMRKTIYGETTPHPDIASSLNNIGLCWSHLGDQRKAISYYEQSLTMMKAIYGETTPHPDIASSLNNIGNCWSALGDQRKAISYHEQSLKMRKAIYQVSAMLRVCEKLREADEKGRRYGLARAETGYLRALVDAMADTDRLAEVELLKTLGDVNVEKGRLGKDVGRFNTAMALYIAAMVRCYHEEQADGIEHRYHYTERLVQGLSSQGKEQPTEDKETTTPAKVAGKFQDLDKRRATGGNTDSLLVGYAQVMVEAIVKDNSMLETEAIKSLGDVYLKRGTETGDTRDLTRATALYNRALVRCHNVHGTVVIVHRLLHTAKIRQDITTTRNKRSTRTEGQDVRGRKGHSSAFSAAPSSDRTTSQVDDDISYHRYIQTADRDLGNGDLDAAEQNLAAALKLVHDRSKPIKAKEADCLCRLGDVYVERGKRTGEGRKFTQAAALYNASMARTDGDKQNMVTKLQETERQFLRNTCNLDCEPSPYSSALDHIKELDNSRARAKSQLDAIHQEHNPYQYDEDDPVVREVETKRAEAIKNLFKGITFGRQEFIQVLTDECIAKLGRPPCKYAFIGLGSQATELVTPYSDLEFAILIEEGKDDDDTRRYFLNLTHYLHLKVINLGETILPAMAIPSLNDFLSEDPEKNWFYDSVTPRGFAFDGFMPWASKTPFGRDQTKSKPPVSLIQTPAKLAEYQRLHIALAEGYHLSDILRRVTYLTGDESLVDEYMDRVNKSVDRSPVLSRLSAILMLGGHIQQIVNAEPTAQLLDVKKEIYRFPSVAVDVLSICRGITIPSVWGMIEELHKTQRISDEDAHHLTVLISISAELRLRTYIANGRQKDRLSPLTEMKVQLDKHDVDDTIVESVFYIPDSKMLFRYYYTAIPLKRCIVDTVAKENPMTQMFPTAIFDTTSLTKGKITRELLQLDASRRHLEAALEEAAGVEKKQFEILFELGHVSCWNKLGDQRKAISYHEQSLKMRKAVYGKTTPHPDIAGSLNNIGACWSHLGDHKKAISYYEQSLKMKKAIYGKTTAHPDIAGPLNNIGACWSHLGDRKKAISYHEQSLKMRKAIYGETTPHPDIASSLNNIENCRPG